MEDRRVLATFNVTTLVDSADGTCDAHCSLREAIIAANAAADSDTIQIPAGTYVLSLTGDDQNGGDLDITRNVTLQGAGANVTAIDANSIDRVFDVHMANVSFHDLSIVRGRALDGGGIYSDGGVVSLLKSSLVQNQATRDGGALYVSNLGVISAFETTFHSNSATGSGGAIYSAFGAIGLTNSTVSGNTATLDGGGMFNAALSDALLSSTTITNNTAGNRGGGIYRVGGDLRPRSTIVAGNAAPAGPDIFGTINSQGFNLVGSVSGATGLVATDLRDVDAKLGVLQNNGGTVLTHELLVGSPAVDAGDDPNARPLDQRGRNRIIDGDGNGSAKIDIGSVEIGTSVIRWAGDIPDGTIWKGSDIHLITADVRVPAGASLSIEPGAIVKFGAFPFHYDLRVEGTLTAIGTSANRIVFTEFRDDVGGDTNADGAASSPSRGNWGRIEVLAAGSATLEQADIRYGGSDSVGQVTVTGGSLTLRDSKISFSSVGGLRVNTANPILQNVRFEDNINAAVSMDLASSPAITGGSYSNNAVNGVVLDAGTLAADTVWDDPDIVYMLSGDVTVPVGTTLTIGAGQIIKTFSTSSFIVTSNILVNGRLLSQGTPQEPVIVTSRRDDSVGGNTTNDNFGGPGPGDWGAIRFSATSAGSVLEHTEVRYGGGFFFTGAVQFVGGELSMTGGAVSNSATSGIRVDSGTPNITGVTFDGNLNAAIGMNLSSNPKIVGGTYTANGVNGVLLDPGSLTADAVWDDPDVVYRLNGDLTVPAGRTLTIAPGQIVKSFTQLGFVASSNLLIDGRLNADGTPNQPIIFTSRRDDSAGGDTNNDLNSSGVKGDWGGIRFSSTSAGNVLDYVEVRYAGGQVLSAAVEVNGASVSLSNSALSDSVEAGLRVTNARPKLTNVAFEDNNGAAIRMDLASDIESLGGLMASGNGTNAILVDAGTLTADRSWTAKDLIYQLGGTVAVNVGIALTIGDGVRLDMPQGIGLSGTGALNNAGTIRKSTGTGSSTIAPSTVNTGSIVVQSGTLNFTASLTNNGNGFVRGPIGTALGVSKNLDGNTQNVVKFEPQSTIQFRGSGTPAAPQLFEVLSRDQGSSDIGFIDNFAFYSIALSNNTRVKLVDNANNAPGAEAEAVYVNSLSIPSGTALDLNGLKLYTRATTGTGIVTGGTVTILPDGGPLTIDTLTAGRIAVATEVDDWTFFGRAGQAITVTLATGTSSPTPPISPTINFGRVTLSDPDGNSLGTANNAASGQEVSLAGIVLPKDGLYHVKVQAPQTPPTSTGNYILAAWNATVVTSPLVLNETVHGDIDTPFRTDRWTFSGQAGQVFNFKLVNAESTAIQFDLTGPNGFTAFSNQSSSVNNVTLPAAGHYALSVHGSQRQTGAYAFRLESVSVTDLTLGTPFNGQIVGGRQSQLFKVNVPETRQLRVTLADSSASDRNEVYLQFGSAPTRRDFQYKFNTPASANQRVNVPSAAPGDWFILIYTEAAPNPGNITLLAEAASIFLSGVTPDRAGTGLDATFTISGMGFDGATTVSLISASLAEFPASSVQIDGATRLTANFIAASVPAGVYSLGVKKGEVLAALPDAIRIVAGGQARLETNVIVPKAVGYHIPAVVYVEYKNSGDAAMPSPVLALTPRQTYADGTSRTAALLTLDQAKVTQGFWTSAIPDGFSNQIQILATGATAGVLQPGDSMRLPVYYSGWQQPWDFSYPPINFDLLVMTVDNLEPINWAEIKDRLRPTGFGSEAWEAVFSNLTAQTGTKYGDLVKMLNATASYLGSLGQNVTNINDLYTFALAQANNFAPVGRVANVVDVQSAVADLPLAFTRNYDQLISSRYTLGPLGRGWAWGDGWLQKLNVEGDGTVMIADPAGAARRFQPDSRSGNYFSPPGDRGKLVRLADGSFLVEESNGIQFSFRADGLIEYKQSASGARIMAGYTDGRITSLTHSSASQDLQLEYNAAGRIARIVDSATGTTTYGYDATSQHLLEVTGPDGRKTIYTYHFGDGTAREHALTSITYADGTHDFLTYDMRGRLIEQRGDNNANKTQFTPGAHGQLTVTDGNGAETKLWFNSAGLIARIEDPLGRRVEKTYDQFNRPIQVIDPAGQITTAAYDAQGRLIRITDAAQRTRKMTYDRISGELIAVTNAKGQTVRFGYDPRGNPISVTYPDGTSTKTHYDAQGRPTTLINARGRATQYTYNAAGQITSQSNADGTQTIYEYDNRGNITSTTDATGSTVFVYDADGRLSRINSPAGRFLEYSFDAAGRRTLLSDQTGFKVKYSYDAVGKLTSVRDGSDIVVANYIYDANGRVSRVDRRNGTFSTYAYNSAGQLESLVNHGPGGIQSTFDYNYDLLGRPEIVRTKDGTWNYIFDTVGQLTKARFASINGSIADQTLDYTYDVAGNITSTTVDGVTTAYQLDVRNRYVKVGDVQNIYDDDGNLIAQSGTTHTATYTYDDLNRIIAANTLNGQLSIRYDPFGNRIGFSNNDESTDLAIDLLAAGTVFGEFGNNGELIAHNVFGVGLETRINAAGSDFFYGFDAAGNTVTLSDDSGSILDQYRYLPFGGLLNESVNGFSSQAAPPANPFRQSGQFGGRFDGIDFGLGDPYSPFSGPCCPGIVPAISPQTLDLAGQGIEFLDGFFRGSTPFAEGYNVGNGTWINITASAIDLLQTIGEKGISKSGLSGGGLGAALANAAFDAIGGKITEGRPYDQLDTVSQAAVNLLAFFGQAASLTNTGITFAAVSAAGAPVAIVSLGGALAIAGTAATAWGLGVYIDDYLINSRFGQATGLKKLVDVQFDIPFYVWEIITGSFTGVAGSMDPNDKIGPRGFGPNGFVKDDGVFAYRVNFENDKDATAPAQQVRITDQLSENLNWDTFEFTEFGFGDEFITAPQGSQSFLTAVPMTVDGATFDVLITADFFSQTGMVVVLFQSIDPTTELPPDVLLGFLPPEDSTGRGQGHFSFLIEPKTNLATGTQIRNIALITFDSNPPIATNQIDPHDASKGTDIAKEALNTIDVGVPTSSVTPLASQSSPTFKVTWSGSDDALGPTGSGIATFDVFVSDDAGPWTLWLDDTPLNSSDFSGVINHTYRFYTIATDNVGHVEDKNAVVEATTIVVAGPRWQNASNPFDVTNDGFVSPIDVLVIVNTLNHPELGLGNGPLPLSGPLSPPPFLDTNGDGFVSPIDVLLVVNFLNRQSGEGESTADALGAAFTTTSQLAHHAAADHWLLAMNHERSFLRRDETKSLPSPVVQPRRSMRQSPLLSRFNHATIAPDANLPKRYMGPDSPPSLRLSAQVVDEFFGKLSEGGGLIDDID